MNARFEFHFCTESPHSNQVIGFDVYFRWSGLDPHKVRFSEGEEMVLHVESKFVTEDWDFMPLFRLRESRRFFWVGGKRFPLTSSGSGGNWHWTVITTPWQRQPHVINWLRRQPGLDYPERDVRFFEQIWCKRGTVQLEDLKRFAIEWAKELSEDAKEELSS